MKIGKWLMEMIAGTPAPQMIPVRVTDRAHEAEAARQMFDRRLRDAQGSQSMTDAIRRLRG
ncbi:MAG: hypothetical protein IPK59_20475 [Rhodospirillaceae bacterium]|nr:hypothetical protein [Rhodospirillaceae bacterium]